MGKFLTALHVKTTGKEQFIEKFTQLMKKDGYVPCSEDEAAVSYAAAFSEDGWVTLSNGDSTTTELSKTAKKIAEEMDALCFTAEVVDSDFAILNLFAQNGSESRVIVGDGSGYGIEKAPILVDMWKPLIQSGDEREFVRTLSLENTFVEDTLYDIGNILGITPSVMTWCYDEFEEEIGQDGNVLSLSFRKAAEKKLSLNAAFKQVFGEALEPLGFKLIKSKYPYFVRVVDNEIIHTITLAKIPAHYNEFCIKCGVSTVYCGSVDYSMNPHSVEWLDTVYGVYGALAFSGKLQRGTEEFSDVITFSFNEDTLISTLERALKMVQKVVIPLLNGVTDIEACTEYYSLNNRFFSLLSLKDIYENVGFALKYPKDKECEGLLWLVLNNRSCYERQCKQWEQSEIKRVKLFEQMSHISKSDYLANISNIVSDSLSFYDKVFSDKVWLEKAYEELGRRKKENLEKLRGYGLNI